MQVRCFCAIEFDLGLATEGGESLLDVLIGYVLPNAAFPVDGALESQEERITIDLRVWRHFAKCVRQRPTKLCVQMVYDIFDFDSRHFYFFGR
jgi:hypothetical protein